MPDRSTSRSDTTADGSAPAGATVTAPASATPAPATASASAPARVAPFTARPAGAAHPRRRLGRGLVLG
jgi:hypothetical protein